MSTPEGIYERQKLDCNCSDCKHLIRSIVRRQQSVDLHYRWQKDYFDGKRMKLLKKFEFWRERGEKKKAKLVLNEARKMEFQFDESECAIHYGKCLKFNKEVSFIPEVLQLETQNCFKHRKNLGL